MNEEILDCYLQAGKIAANAREYGLTLIKPQVTLLEVAAKVEERIVDGGAGIAFPVNISINDLAAHYSPIEGDNKVFSKGDVVKLDVGAHINGYIADTAKTIAVETHKHDQLIDASHEALQKAIDILKANQPLSSIGEIVQKTITKKGFQPIENLTGHSLEQYNLHSGLSVPNVPTQSTEAPQVDDVIAIEPFATTGAGYVIAGQGSNIYRLTGSLRTRFVREQRARMVLMKMNKQFKTLPFAQRWCTDFSKNIDATLKRLTLLGALKHYPQLVEKRHGLVSQCEHTVIVNEDGCEVTT